MNNVKILEFETHDGDEWVACTIKTTALDMEMTLRCMTTIDTPRGQHLIIQPIRNVRIHTEVY